MSGNTKKEQNMIVLQTTITNTWYSDNKKEKIEFENHSLIHMKRESRF